MHPDLLQQDLYATGGLWERLCLECEAHQWHMTAGFRSLQNSSFSAKAAFSWSMEKLHFVLFLVNDKILVAAFEDGKWSVVGLVEAVAYRQGANANCLASVELIVEVGGVLLAAGLLWAGKDLLLHGDLLAQRSSQQAKVGPVNQLGQANPQILLHS